MTREQLLNPELNGQSYKDFVSGMLRYFLEDDVLITQHKTSTGYAFKKDNDAAVFITHLERNDISHGIMHPKLEEEFPYVIVLEVDQTLSPKNLQVRDEIRENFKTNTLPTSLQDRTYFTPESLAEAIAHVQALKTIVIKAQSYEMAAKLRDFEKTLLAKKEQDDNRRI